jgi:hypothetical protein
MPSGAVPSRDRLSSTRTGRCAGGGRWRQRRHGAVRGGWKCRRRGGNRRCDGPSRRRYHGRAEITLIVSCSADSHATPRRGNSPGLVRQALSTRTCAPLWRSVSRQGGSPADHDCISATGARVRRIASRPPKSTGELRARLSSSWEKYDRSGGRYIERIGRGIRVVRVRIVRVRVRIRRRRDNAWRNKETAEEDAIVGEPAVPKKAWMRDEATVREKPWMREARVSKAEMRPKPHWCAAATSLRRRKVGQECNQRDGNGERSGHRRLPHPGRSAHHAVRADSGRRRTDPWCEYSDARRRRLCPAARCNQITFS